MLSGGMSFRRLMWPYFLGALIIGRPAPPPPPRPTNPAESAPADSGDAPQE